MQMSDFEIRQSYEQAKNKKEQVKILAQLNCCSQKKIEAIVHCEEYVEEKRSVPKTISADLKRKIADEALEGKLNKKQIAEKYGVSYSAVKRWAYERKLERECQRDEGARFDDEIHLKCDASNVLRELSLVANKYIETHPNSVICFTAGPRNISLSITFDC